MNDQSHSRRSLLLVGADLCWSVAGVDPVAASGSSRSAIAFAASRPSEAPALPSGSVWRTTRGRAVAIDGDSPLLGTLDHVAFELRP